MIFIKININDTFLLPCNVFDKTIPDNPVLLKIADFNYNFILQSNYKSPDIIAIILAIPSVFNDWYSLQNDGVKQKIEIISEDFVFSICNQFIQICSPANPLKSNTDIIKEYLLNLT